MSEADIRTWQAHLRGSVAPTLKIDGGFGPATLAASRLLLPKADAAQAIDYTERVRVPPMPPGYGLAPCRQSTAMAVFGAPGALSENCSEPFRAIQARMVTGRVHDGFRVTGFGPAVEAVHLALQHCKAENPVLYGLLGTAGMLCVRKVRGGSTFSNHSWGTAIDIKIGGKLDALGDGWCQRGLLELEPHFRAVGFFWGAWFSREDAQHFEAGDALVREWGERGLVT